MKIFVGNLSFNTTEQSLRALFEARGEIEEVAIVTDRESGRSRGFGFVTMADNNAARTAIEELNGYELDGRALNVSEARAKADRPRGGGGGGGYGGGRGGGRRDRW